MNTEVITNITSTTATGLTLPVMITRGLIGDIQRINAAITSGAINIYRHTEAIRSSFMSTWSLTARVLKNNAPTITDIPRNTTEGSHMLITLASS